VTFLPPFLKLLHLVGLSLAVGAATVKVVLLLRSWRDATLLPAYFAVARPVTKLIITGMIFLALSGIGWLIVAYDLTPLLIVKLVLFGCVFVLGPIIDNVAEPKFKRLAPSAGQAPSPAFIRARTLYMTLEFAATGLFYAIVLLWVLMA
jgi:uncharacterized membrane protein